MKLQTLVEMTVSGYKVNEKGKTLNTFKSDVTIFVGRYIRIKNFDILNSSVVKVVALGNTNDSAFDIEFYLPIEYIKLFTKEVDYGVRGMV